jgi:hypothetical protein
MTIFLIKTCSFPEVFNVFKNKYEYLEYRIKTN